MPHSYQISFELRKPGLIDRHAWGWSAGCVVPKTPPDFSDLATGYGVRLRATRIALEYATATAAAKKFNTTLARWNNWELEKNPPDLHTMLALKFMHGVPLDWIYAGDPQALPNHLVQKLVTAGASPDALVPLKVLRLTLGRDPLIASGPRTLQEPQQRIK